MKPSLTHGDMKTFMLNKNAIVLAPTKEYSTENLEDDEEKQKWEISKFVHLPAEHGCLSSRPVYSMAVLYLTLIALFRQFSA